MQACACAYCFLTLTNLLLLLLQVLAVAPHTPRHNPGAGWAAFLHPLRAGLGHQRTTPAGCAGVPVIEHGASVPGSHRCVQGAPTYLSPYPTTRKTAIPSRCSAGRQASFSIWDVFPHRIYGRLYLADDMSVSADDSTYHAFQALSVASIVLWTVGIPACAVMLLVKNRHALQTPAFQAQYVAIPLPGGGHG